MNLMANKLPIVLLVITALMWSSLVQAFFCFSVGTGGGSKQRNHHFVRPPPPSDFGAVGYPLFHYSPVLQSPVARPGLLPVAVSPAATAGSVKQQIFE